MRRSFRAELLWCSPPAFPRGSFLPRSIRGWFPAAHRAALPYAVHRVVADGAENQRELPRKVVQVQGANAGQVGAQVSVDPRTLDAYEGAQVETGPGWILERVGTCEGGGGGVL